MPTLDDTPILQTLGELKGHDSLIVSDKDGSGSSLIKRVPSALVTMGFSHGFLFNFDNSQLAAADNTDAQSFDVYTFDANDRVDRAMLICTKAFTGPSLGATVVRVGVNDQAVQGYIADTSVTAVGFAENSGSLIDTEVDTVGSYDDPTDGDTLRITFNPATCKNKDLTAGQFVVLVNIVNPTHFQDCLDPQ
tara:strand:- start:2044 stop:2619 length:576 start_codon:yes stop_codon:yes gene_type:complete